MLILPSNSLILFPLSCEFNLRMTFKKGKKANYLFIFSFLILSLSKGYGQERLIHGLIILDVDEPIIEKIHVTNSRTQLTSFTDLTGSFSMRAMVGDILYIRSSLYESRQFLLTEALINKSVINIHLNLQPVLLEEAVISPKLSGYLDKDVRYSPDKDRLAKLYRNLGFNPDVSNLRDTTPLEFWKDFSPTHFNVERVFEAISGDLRRRQSLYKHESKQNKINGIHSYFGDNYFVQDLNIPKEKISDFLTYSYDSSTIPLHYSKGNYFSIMIELNRLAPIFLSRLNTWYTPVIPPSKE